MSLVVTRGRVADHPEDLESLGEEVGRAIVNYSSAEIARIKGRKSSEIATVLGYAGKFGKLYIVILSTYTHLSSANQILELNRMNIFLDSEYVAHRDNTAFFPEKVKSTTDLQQLVTAAEVAEAAAMGACN